MNRAVRGAAGVICLGFVAAGLTGAESLSDARWLAILSAAGVLLLVAAWAPLSSAVPIPKRTTIRTATVLGTVFALLSIQLVRIQVLHQDYTVDRVATAPNGEIIANPRRAGVGLDEARGRILDRNGNVLAYSRDENGVYRRIYPDSSVAPIVGYYSPLQYGSSGLESAYDDALSGQSDENPWNWFERIVLGRTPSGNDLRLTVDLDLQQAATDLLGDQVGAAVLIDVETGAVLALASTPAPDPNQLVATDRAEMDAAAAYWASLNEDPNRPLVPRGTTGLYAPGSTFKTITAAAAIDSGVAEPDTVYEDDGDLDIDGRILVENNRPDPSIDEWTLRDGLAYSLNVVYAQVGLALGADRLRDYADRFGLGDTLLFDLPTSESQLEGTPGFIDSPTALADTAFGQGQLLVSPLYMALVASCFANDGVMMRPYLVDQVVSPDGDIVDSVKPARWRQPISAETAAAVRDMMINAVETGYVQAAQIPGLTVGGKTGTAELSDGAPHSWFIGFVGDPEPRYAVAVVLEHGGSGVGASVEVGRELLDLAMAAPVAERTDDLTLTSAVGPQNAAYVQAFLGASTLPFRAKNGKLRHARFGGTKGRSPSTTTVRATGRTRARRTPRRHLGDAGQRRSRR